MLVTGVVSVVVTGLTPVVVIGLSVVVPVTSVTFVVSPVSVVYGFLAFVQDAKADKAIAPVNKPNNALCFIILLPLNFYYIINILQ